MLLSGPGPPRPASVPSVPLFVTSWAEPWGGGQAEALQETGCPETILRLQVLTASGPGGALREKGVNLAAAPEPRGGVLLGASLKTTKTYGRDGFFLPALSNLPLSLVTPPHGRMDRWGAQGLGHPAPPPSICGDPPGSLLGLVSAERHLHRLGGGSQGLCLLHVGCRPRNRHAAPSSSYRWEN